jgi:predicted SnoaL-like aldol condensation-catalyzing enzyme
MKRILVCIATLLFSGTLFAQAAPVVAVDDPESLFVDDDPQIHRNKQAALHIMRELLQCGQWSKADQWLTERYIQHNPMFGSGRDTVVQAFSGRPEVEDCGELTTGIVAVTHDDRDHVSVIIRRENPDPRNPGETYTTIWVDMWRFVDGKADEHWDTAVINAPAAGGRGRGGPGRGAPPPQ